MSESELDAELAQVLQENQEQLLADAATAKIEEREDALAFRIGQYIGCVYQGVKSCEGVEDWVAHEQTLHWIDLHHNPAHRRAQ